MTDSFYKIDKCTEKEKSHIIEELISYNLSKVEATQNELFVDLSYKIESQGKIIAGIIARMYCWNVVYIDSLWVDDLYKNQHIGTRMLQQVESVSKKMGAYLIHLDTFDFQARDFYEKHGYTVFGKLDDCPRHHCRYFLRKDL